MRISNVFRLVSLAAMLCAGQAGCMAASVTQIDEEDVIEKLSVAQIAGVLVTSNSAEIAQGKIALEKASDPQVQAFAEKMIAEHTESNERIVALSALLGTIPQPSSVSEDLIVQAAIETAFLLRAPESRFDLQYIDQQIRAHEQILSLIDDRLVPEAEGREVRMFLTHERDMIAEHLEHAQSVRDSVRVHQISSQDLIRFGRVSGDQN